MRLLTNNPKKTDAFVYYGYDLAVVDQVPIIAPAMLNASAISTPSATRWAICFPPGPAAGVPVGALIYLPQEGRGIGLY